MKSDAEFRALVGAMRMSQIRYFKHRHPEDLRDAKRYEQAVDNELTGLEQLGLFPKEDSL